MYTHIHTCVHKQDSTASSGSYLDTVPKVTTPAAAHMLPKHMTRPAGGHSTTNVEGVYRYICACSFYVSPEPKPLCTHACMYVCMYGSTQANSTTNVEGVYCYICACSFYVSLEPKP